MMYKELVGFLLCGFTSVPQREVEAEESQIQGHPALQTEFEASQVFGGFFLGGGVSFCLF